MPKYILKKDLPFAKAGKEIKIYERGLGCTADGIYVSEGEPFNDLWIGERNDLPRLIAEGWIEEVKPREFILGIADNGESSFCHLASSAAGKDYWKIRKSSPLGLKEIIKLLEIIED